MEGPELAGADRKAIQLSRVLAACIPPSDAGFRERVRHVVSQDRWNLDSLEGIALMQAVLRGTYPMATVLGHGVSAGGVRRTVVLDVFRDGGPGAAAFAMRFAEAVYDRSAGTAYRAAALILGEGAAAELVVERAFREFHGSVASGLSVDAAGAAIEAEALRLAREARPTEVEAAPGAVTTRSVAESALAETSLRKGGVRAALSGRAIARMLSSQREALELSVLEDLKVNEIAERMQTSPEVVHGHLRDALLAVGSGDPPTASTTLARWREAKRGWAELPAYHRARPERALAVAHAWLDYQVATHAVPSGTVVLITDADRRFVATSDNAAQALGRPSLVGLRIDDVTAAYAQPLVPELWTLFDANGSMNGEYDCDRPGQLPVRTEFHGVWGRPLPSLQVGYLAPPVTLPTGPTTFL